MSFFNKHISAFVMTWQFLTWLPTPSGWYHPKYTSLMSLYMPIVGALIGSLIAICLYVSNLLFPWMVAIAISLAAQGLITGAFHEDGLADVADGMGGYQREKILAIMRDSRLGTYGSYALITIILLRFSALASIEPSQAMLNVIGYAAAGRLAGVLLLVSTNTPQDQTRLGSTVSFYGLWSNFVFALLFTLLINIFLSTGFPFMMLFITLLIPTLLRLYFINRIGGATGDCAGATCVITETSLHIMATMKI